MGESINNKRPYDAIIVGSGFGGGGVAFSLTKLGYRVLLIEKGRSDAVHRAMQGASEAPEDKLSQGRWPTKIPFNIDGQESLQWPVIGCGVGGSSIHYGATLERLIPDDFARQTLPDGREVNWPFDYKELEPYYLEAEALFNVCGTADPLEKGNVHALLDPPRLCEADTELFAAMQSAGLHPFQLHVGLNRSTDCTWCASGPCTIACKSDVRNTFLEPAERSGNLTLLEQTEVLELIHDARRVTGVKVRHESGLLDLSARCVVLAAGALFSPRLLLQSTSDAFPRGLGNNNDIVGRYLMFHAWDLLAIWQSRKLSRDGMTKSIGSRAFYRYDETSFGEIQSMGLTAGYGDILNFLHGLLARSALGRISLFRHLARIPAYIAAKVLKEATVMCALVEDYPYADNRVRACDTSASGIRVEYQLRDELVNRVKKQRQLLKNALSSLRLTVLNPGIQLNYGHPCGTCRSGDDPSDSVVDSDCRVHGIDNLYVADASVMPTSGGTNPSLTIAANALRVADKIAAKLG